MIVAVATSTSVTLTWTATAVLTWFPLTDSVSCGFQGTWTALLASPTAFSVNGAACLVG
jgi:hypothetical protein